MDYLHILYNVSSMPGLHSLGSLRSPRSVDPISNLSLANHIPQLPKCQQKHMATIKHKNNSS